MSRILTHRGYQPVSKAEQAAFLIVNTCGFIQSAKEEAISAILDLAGIKKQSDQNPRLVVAGCLSQRYAQEIKENLPEVDALIGTADYSRIADVLDKLRHGDSWEMQPVKAGSLDHLAVERQPSTPATYAYIKVAEGCSNRCAYCAIPAIRGSYQSRPIEDLVAEARYLSERGYQELILIAQDTTRYGLDLYGRLMLPELLRQICALPEVRLVRILYVYADSLTDDLIERMASEKKIAHYLDLPVQHASDAILKRMNRRDSADRILRLVKRLRQAMPDIILRSTVMVGYPGERAEDQKQLLQFLREVRFDRLGCFIFSPEEGTPAFRLRPRVRKVTAENRFRAVMELQKTLSRQANQARVGQVIAVTLESIDQSGIFYIGRSYGEAPDVDPLIYVAGTSDDLQIGQTVMVRLVEAGDYDLTGVTTDEPA